VAVVIIAILGCGVVSLMVIGCCCFEQASNVRINVVVLSRKIVYVWVKIKTEKRNQSRSE
jgi:hypothetical protein